MVTKNLTNRIHIIPGNDDWRIVRPHALRATAIVKTQNEAIKRAVEIAKNENILVYVHRLDGKISSIEDYTNISRKPNPRRSSVSITVNTGESISKARKFNNHMVKDK